MKMGQNSTRFFWVKFSSTNLFIPLKLLAIIKDQQFSFLYFKDKKKT